MKFQIDVNCLPLKGYVTLDPHPREGVPQYTGDISELPCEKGECTEILAPNILNYIHHSQLNILIERWKECLRKKHKLIIGGIDPLILNRLYSYGNITTPEYNDILFSSKGLYPMCEIEQLLVEYGFKITKKVITNHTYILEGEK